MTSKELTQMTHSELVERYDDLKEAYGLTDSPIQQQELTIAAAAVIAELGVRANA